MQAVTDRDALTAVVQRASGSTAELRRARCEPLVENPENMTTASLLRYSGELADGTPWSVVAKTLRPASQSPLWSLVPEEFRAMVLNDLHWHDEPRLYELGLDAHLPEGIRVPRIWRIDRADDAITLWMEDVDDHPTWDSDRYHRSAVALGRMAGRWPEDRAVADLALTRRSMHNLFFGKITNLDLKALAEDSFWSAAPVSELNDHSLRGDLATLARRMPALLDHALTLPHGMAHGDAAPANLLDPGDGDIVAVDWSYGASAPMGSDLSQLFAGRYDSGDASPDDIGGLIRTIVDGFCEGLDAEGSGVTRQQVEAAFAIHLGVRTVFSALIVQGGEDMTAAELERLLGVRSALARAGRDLCAAVAI